MPIMLPREPTRLFGPIRGALAAALVGACASSGDRAFAAPSSSSFDTWCVDGEPSGVSFVGLRASQAPSSVRGETGAPWLVARVTSEGRVEFEARGAGLAAGVYSAEARVWAYDALVPRFVERVEATLRVVRTPPKGARRR